MSLPADAVRCSKSVRTYGMGFQWHQCRSAGKAMRDGKMFCGTHDPVAIRAKEDAKRAKWEIQRKADEVRYAERRRELARAELCVTACAGLTDDEVRGMTKFSRGVIREFFTGNL